MFEDITTLDDVRKALYFVDGRYPLRAAEPGPLMERAVEITGEDGMTLQQLREVFSLLGKERFERGLRFMRDAGEVAEQRERRPNRAGRLQEQVVFYRAGAHSGAGPEAITTV